MPISKSYSEEGTYVISAYAMDVNMAESGIATLEVAMPVSHTTIYNMFLGFLEQHPRILPILRILLGL